MGLFGNLFSKGQFIDIVQWEDETPGVLVHRFDRQNNEIKNHAKLVVRPGQKAIFVNEGVIADMFSPGTYELQTANMPILTTLLSLPYNFESWHKAEVYFVKTTDQLDRRWGTMQPVAVRDADFGIVRLRAFGNYSYRIGTTNDLLQRFVGARSEFTAEDLENQFSMKIISELSDSLGELKIPVLDLPAQYTEIGDLVKQKLTEAAGLLGLELLTFIVGNINLPEEVTQAIDKRGALGALGGVNQYTQMKAADAMLAAAQNSGASGNMMGFMMGGQLGTMVNQTATQTMQQPPPPPPAAPVYYLAVNGQRQGPYTAEQLQQMAMNGTFSAASMVWTTGMAGWQAANTVPALATILGSVPPPLA